MVKIFGQSDFREKTLLKRTLAIWASILCIKVIGFSLLQNYSDLASDFYANSYVKYEVVMLFFWVGMDLAPSVFIYRMHFINFKSFEDDP